MALLDTLLADMAFAVSQLYDLLNEIKDTVENFSDQKRILFMNRILMIVTDYYFCCSIVPPLESLETSSDIDICKVLRGLSLKLPELELCFKETYLGMDCIFKCGLSQQVIRAIFMGLCAWRVTFDAKIYKAIFLKCNRRGELEELFSALRFNLVDAKPKRIKHICSRTEEYSVTSGSFVFTLKPPFSKKMLRYIQIIDDYIKDYKTIHYIYDYAINQKINTSYLRGETISVRRAIVHNILVKFYNRHAQGDKSITITYVCHHNE